MDYKFTLLTPCAYAAPDGKDHFDDVVDKFAKLLKKRSEEDFKLPCNLPTGHHEAYFENFDQFEATFLRHSEYAVIIVSGKSVPQLTKFFVRLFVFLQVRPSWANRFVFLFLGPVVVGPNIDFSVLVHKPIQFSQENWESKDSASFTSLFGLLKVKWVPHVDEEKKEVNATTTTTTTERVFTIKRKTATSTDSTVTVKRDNQTTIVSDNSQASGSKELPIETLKATFVQSMQKSEDTQSTENSNDQGKAPPLPQMSTTVEDNVTNAPNGPDTTENILEELRAAGYEKPIESKEEVIGTSKSPSGTDVTIVKSQGASVEGDSDPKSSGHGHSHGGHRHGAKLSTSSHTRTVVHVSTEEVVIRKPSSTSSKDESGDEVKKADEEKKKADEEKTKADEAKKKADDDKKKAEEVSRKADEEKKKADEDKKKADEARRKADEEKKKVDEDKKKADEARRKADEEKKKVDEDKKKAEEEKKKKADEDKKKADDAKRKADEEKKKADEDKKKAEEVKRKAEEDKKKADDAKRKADEDRKKADDAKRKADEDKKKADDAKRKAEENKNKADEKKTKEGSGGGFFSSIFRGGSGKADSKEAPVDSTDGKDSQTPGTSVEDVHVNHTHEVDTTTRSWFSWSLPFRGFRRGHGESVDEIDIAEGHAHVLTSAGATDEGDEHSGWGWSFRWLLPSFSHSTVDSSIVEDLLTHARYHGTEHAFEEEDRREKFMDIIKSDLNLCHPCIVTLLLVAATAASPYYHAWSLWAFNGLLLFLVREGEFPAGVGVTTVPSTAIPQANAAPSGGWKYILPVGHPVFVTPADGGVIDSGADGLGGFRPREGASGPVPF